MTKILRVPYIAALDGEVRDLRATVEANGVEAKIDVANWPDANADCPSAKATLAHSLDAIYIVFEAYETTVKAVVDRDLGPVSSDSCFEFFVEPDAEEHRYRNFEFNAIGYLNASHRVRRSEPTRFDAAMLSAVNRIPSLGRTPFDERATDKPWTLTVRIPFATLGVEYAGKPITMRGNIYKCASAKTKPHYLSWAPIDTEKPDFHRPEFFATMVFE